MNHQDVPAELLTFEERVNQQREALLQELEGCSLGLGHDDEHEEVYGITDTEDARTVLATAQALEAVDRIACRRRGDAPAQTNVFNNSGPGEGEIRTALWHAMEEAGCSAQLADDVTARLLTQLGYNADEGGVRHAPDETNADNDSGASG